MICLGVDPDLHNTGIAIADEDRIYTVCLAKIDAKIKGEDAVRCMIEGALRNAFLDLLHRGYREKVQRIVVEGQNCYMGPRNRNRATPETLIKLAHVAGAAYALAQEAFGSATTYVPGRIPLPGQWKGQVPKEIHQSKILEHYGIAHDRKKDYCVPLPGAMVGVQGWESIQPLSNWKHVVDAIGLALWGSKQSLLVHVL